LCVGGGLPEKVAKRIKSAVGLAKCGAKEQALRAHIVELEAALRAITYRDSSGSVVNAYVEDVDLREYAPILEQLHKPE
jgi:hypothetical protein